MCVYLSFVLNCAEEVVPGCPGGSVAHTRRDDAIMKNLVLVGYGPTHVNHREQAKTYACRNRNKNVQGHENDRYHQVGQSDENIGDLFARVHIAIQTNRERKHAGELPIISIGIMSGASHHTGPAKCARYFRRPCSRIPMTL